VFSVAFSFWCWANWAKQSSIQDNNGACIRDHLQQCIIVITNHDSSG
jgi:hypothetical protein